MTYDYFYFFKALQSDKIIEDFSNLNTFLVLTNKDDEIVFPNESQSFGVKYTEHEEEILVKWDVGKPTVLRI